MEAYDLENLKKGDFVAAELGIKRWTDREKVARASFELKGLIVLRKGKQEDEDIVNAALADQAGDNIASNSFYANLNAGSPVKGKGKGRAY